jgi:hypothetical protein
VAGGMDDEEGIGGEMVAGLFGVGLTADLPLSRSTVAPLLAPFA